MAFCLFTGQLSKFYKQTKLVDDQQRKLMDAGALPASSTKWALEAFSGAFLFLLTLAKIYNICYNLTMVTPVVLGSREIPAFSVKREGFPPPPRRETRFSFELDIEFFESFLKALIDHSLEPDDLVFNGFDGTDIKKGLRNPNTPQRYIWVVDEKTWRKGLTYTTPSSPADYAERFETPCIGIYAKDQLRIVNVIDGERLRPHQLSDFEREGLDITRPLKALHDEHPDAEIYDPVTNIGYPDGQVTDALRGLAFLEY